MTDVRIDHGVTSGTFSLDGQTFDVDNNVWVVGNDDECLVIDAPHSVEGIQAVIAGRQSAGDRLHPCPRRPRTGGAGAGGRGRRTDPAASRRRAGLGADPPRRRARRPAQGRQADRRRRHRPRGAAHAGPRPGRGLPVLRRTSASSSPATRCSRAARARPGAASPTTTRSWRASGRSCSRCPTRPSCTPATATPPRSAPKPLPSAANRRGVNFCVPRGQLLRAEGSDVSVADSAHEPGTADRSTRGRAGRDRAGAVRGDDARRAGRRRHQDRPARGQPASRPVAVRPDQPRPSECLRRPQDRGRCRRRTTTGRRGRCRSSRACGRASPSGSGSGPTSCSRRSPQLVYGRMTGWGQDGPKAAAGRP